MVKNEKIEIMSVSFLNLRKDDYVKIVSERIFGGEKTVVFTPNPQILLSARKDKEAKKALQSASINLPDGAGILIASKILRFPIKETVCGIDFAEELLALAQEKKLSVFLLGGKEGRAEEAKAALKKKFPSLDICGVHHGYFQKYGQENEALIKKITAAAPDIIFVCLGFPTQEKWICQSTPRIPCCKLAIGLGGSIDVWSGHVKRAPRIFRRMRLEWLWRAVREPRRLRILWDIPVFLLAILNQRAFREKRNAHKYRFLES